MSVCYAFPPILRYDTSLSLSQSLLLPSSWPLSQSGLAKESDTKSNGDPVDDAQLGLLKGAARIHTAIAVVIFLWRKGDKVGDPIISFLNYML